MHNSRLRAQFSTVVTICHGKWSVPARNFTPARKWLPLAWKPQNFGQTCILFGVNLFISQEKRTNTFQTSVMKVHKQGATFEFFFFKKRAHGCHFDTTRRMPKISFGGNEDVLKCFLPHTPCTVDRFSGCFIRCLHSRNYTSSFQNSLLPPPSSPQGSHTDEQGP